MAAPHRAWFRRTPLGGAPITWEGWVATLAFTLILMGGETILPTRFAAPAARALAAIGYGVGLTLVFLWIAVVKSEGAPPRV